MAYISKINNFINNTDYDISAMVVKITDTVPTTDTTYYPNFTTGKTENSNYVLRANTGLVFKDNGTISGEILISNRQTAYVSSKSSTTSIRVSLDSANSGNHGVYSWGYWDGETAHTASGDQKWLVYRNTSGDVILNGNAATATKLATARTLTIGSTGKTFDGSANVSWSHADIGATVSNTWTAGTTAGPTIKTTVNGVAGTAVAIPSASKTASGVITTGTQDFQGRKGFGYMNRYGYNDSGTASQWTADTYCYNAAGNIVAEYWYDTGDATNVTSGTWGIRGYSPNSTADTTTTGKYETFYLPTVNTGRTDNASYNILTSKNAVTIAQGGTGATTAAGARANLGLGSLATKNGLAWNEITQSGANSLPNGNSDFTDNTELLTSYASNDGFDATSDSGPGKVYKRDAICMYNYIKTKASGTWGISISGNAATATKATQDGSGNTITSKYVTVDTAQNITGLKTFKSLIQAYRFSVDTASRSLPFMTFDKPGSNATGIGPDGTNNRIHFGPCPLDGSSWVSTSTFNSNEWHFQGYLTTTNTLAVPAGIWQKVELIHADSNAQSAGWYRTCVVACRHNYADFLLSFTGDWTNGAPNVGLLHVCMRNGQAKIAILHGGFNGRITQVRLVKNATNSAYLDLYLQAMSNSTAALFANFLGNVNVTSVATTNTITTSTTDVLDTVDLSLYNFQINGTGKFTSVYGAVWNDYAEFRITKNKIEPGRCIIETGNDDLVLSTKRLQPGAEIVSDTFGFAIGETDEAKTPIASNGRVLAYIYEGREAARANIGKPVCSGPDGTVSIMTDEEYQKYGYCAIGTISAVPDYEEWGTEKVKVNNRIWIRIR